MTDRDAVPTPGAPEAAAVRSMFDRIAPRYDLLNRLLSAGADARWRRRAVDWLELRPGARVLDLCTGTGDLLIEALARDHTAAGVGVDISQRMLRLGRRKLARRRLRARALLAAGEAVRLPLRTGSIDGALVGFGIRNVGDPLAALRELHRILRPGGRLVVLEFSLPEGGLGAIYRLYFARLLPRLAGLLSDGSAYAYLPASVARFPSAQDFAGLMSEAGFTDVRWRFMTARIVRLQRGEKTG